MIKFVNGNVVDSNATLTLEGMEHPVTWKRDEETGDIEVICDLDEPVHGAMVKIVGPDGEYNGLMDVDHDNSVVKFV